MPDAVGIRFKRCGKIYDFSASDLELRRGDIVVVESELGLSIGNVVSARELPDTAKDLKKVLRKATEEDIRKKKENESFGAEARSYCQNRIMARGLPMKLIHAEVTLDRKRIIFYFTAESRIDFRELVKDLAAKFKTRIEMRQIGVRDEAKLIGGIGICGQELCCKTFLTSFEPISIRMAKSQELVLNASKLSGVCGRLMCCLSYEYMERGRDGSVDESEESVAEEQTEAITPAVPEPPTAHPGKPAEGEAAPFMEKTRSPEGQKAQHPAPVVRTASREDRSPEAPPPGEKAGGVTVKPEGAPPEGQAGEGRRKRFRRRRRRGRKFEK